MGRGDDTELHYLHGCSETETSSERSVASHLARVSHWLRPVQGEQRMGRAESDGRMVSSLRSETLFLHLSLRLITLNAMKASEEISEEQSRQVSGLST